MTALAPSHEPREALRRTVGAPAARRRHLRVVGEPAHARAPRRVLKITVVTVVAALLVIFAIALMHVSMAQTAFELDRQRDILAERREERQQLALAVALLEAPERIRAEAMARLGMVDPGEVHYVESEEGTSGNDTDPDAADPQAKDRSGQGLATGARESAASPPSG